MKHEMWLSLVHSCFFSPCSVFLVIFLCFFVGISGAWYHVYHRLMMLEIGLWMLLEVGTQVCKKENGSVVSCDYCFMRTIFWH